MQNKTLAISRGCIPYIKELRNIAGSVTASILMQQLDYWFDKTNGNPFYKFKSQCENEYYKSGDSFTEELGFSIEEFTNAFAKIGISYKSKTEFENTIDKFQGMFYCSYFDRKEGLTFYFRNHELLDSALNALFTVKRESRFTENGKVDLQKTGKSISPIYITEDYNSRLQQNINTASGLSQNENPTVKDSLQVQKPKKEIEILEKNDIENFVRNFKANKFQVDGVIQMQSIFSENEIDLITEWILRRKSTHKSKVKNTEQAITGVLNDILDIKKEIPLETIFEQRDGCYINCGASGDASKTHQSIKLEFFTKLIKKSTNNNNYGKPKPDYLEVQKRYAEAGELQLSTTYRKRRD